MLTQDQHFLLGQPVTEFNHPTRWRLYDPLDELKAKLQRLEQAGDSASPTIADLKRILSQRISELEQLQEAAINRP